MPPSPRTVRDVLLFVPNVIGFARLALLAVAAALHATGHHAGFTWVYLLSSAGDLLDGYAARSLGQCSRFGEMLDVMVDNLSRSLLWMLVAQALPPGLTLPVAVALSLEWVTFVCTHTTAALGRTNWKSQHQAGDASQPRVLTLIFANGFKNPVGALTIAGIFYFPLAVYALVHDVAPPAVSHTMLVAVTVVLAVGKALGMWAELWVTQRYLHDVLVSDAAGDRKPA